MGVYTILPESLNEVDVIIAGGKRKNRRQPYNEQSSYPRFANHQHQAVPPVA